MAKIQPQTLTGSGRPDGSTDNPRANHWSQCVSLGFVIISIKLNVKYNLLISIATNSHSATDGAENEKLLFYQIISKNIEIWM